MLVQTNQRPLILHTINCLSLGGAELLLINSIELLPEYDHMVVFLNHPSELWPRFSELGVELICLDYKGWKTMFSAVIKLKKIIKEKKPHLVHSHLFYSTICARLATPKSVPLVSTIHSVYSQDAFKKNRKSLLAALFTLKRRHFLIGVSDYVLKDYFTYIPFRGKRFVLHNFLPDTSFQQAFHNGPKDTIKLIAIGNLKEAKNYWYLLEIIKNIKGVTLDIYGTGPMEKQLNDEILNEQLSVRLCGSTNNTPLVFQQYDFFIQASSHEGFGLSVIEAMGAGIPVLLSDIPVFREITNGLATFFPLDDPLKAAEVLNATFNKEYPTSIADEAYAFVKEKYSARKFKDQLLKIYDQVTQNLYK